MKVYAILADKEIIAGDQYICVLFPKSPWVSTTTDKANAVWYTPTELEFAESILKKRKIKYIVREMGERIVTKLIPFNK